MLIVIELPKRWLLHKYQRNATWSKTSPHSLIHNSTKPNEKEPVLVSYQLLNISAGPGIGQLFKIFIPAEVLVFENFFKKLS
jgi:hypothetical protein